MIRRLPRRYPEDTLFTVKIFHCIYHDIILDYLCPSFYDTIKILIYGDNSFWILNVVTTMRVTQSYYKCGRFCLVGIIAAFIIKFIMKTHFFPRSWTENVSVGIGALDEWFWYECCVQSFIKKHRSFIMITTMVSAPSCAVVHCCLMLGMPRIVRNRFLCVNKRCCNYIVIINLIKGE